MKIVIDIFEDVYEDAKNDIPNGLDQYSNEAIRNGIPLPEGYGDLIDRSVLIDKIESLDRRYGSDFYWETRRIIDKVPTVIKAGK